MKSSEMLSYSKNQFEEIGRNVPGTRGLFSPFESFTADGHDDGNIPDEIKPMMSVLSEADSVSELMFAGNESTQTCLVYSAKSNTAGLKIDENETVTLCTAQVLSKFVDEFLQTMKQSEENNTCFMANLSAKEAWVFGAMVDFQRQSSLFSSGLNDTKPEEIPPIISKIDVIGQVLRLLAFPENSSQVSTVLAGEPAWSVLFCLCNELIPAAISNEEIEATLWDLTRRGLMVQTADGFSLTENIRYFANRYLMPDPMLFLKTGWETNGELEEDQLTCLPAGEFFLYLLTSSDGKDEVCLLGGTSQPLIQVATRVMQKPASLFTLFGVNTSSPNKPASGIICAKCGYPGKAGARFCKKCGTPLIPPPETPPVPQSCQYCGKPLKPNARFCSTCGKPATQ